MTATILETNPNPLKQVTVDSVTVDIIENALKNAREEMDAVLFRTAMSPGIREQGDCFPMIANKNGKMVVGQFGSFIGPFLSVYDAEIEEGDVILTNDPYLCNAAVSHLPDWLVLVPVFKDGRHIAWSAMFGHMSDNGGMVPGSIPVEARTIYQEGIRIPPIKLYKRGQLQNEILDLILHNVRTSQWNRFDLNALVAACNTAARRCVELAERFGDDVLHSTMDIMLQRNYDAMKHVIAMVVPEEPREFTDYVCDDGMGKGPYKIHCKMWREGSKAIFDFAGTAPQAQSSINFYLNEDMFKMFFGSFTINIVDPQIAFNDGFYDLVDVRIPEGTLLKPLAPAALSGRTHALGRIFDVLGALLGMGAPIKCSMPPDSPTHHIYSTPAMTHAVTRTANGFSCFKLASVAFPADPLGMVQTGIPSGPDSPICPTNSSSPTFHCGLSVTRRSPTPAAPASTAAEMASAWPIVSSPTAKLASTTIAGSLIPGVPMAETRDCVPASVW